VVAKRTAAAHVHEAGCSSRCMSPDFGDAQACPLPMRGAPGEIYLRIYVENQPVVWWMRQPAKYVLLFDLDDARKTATTSLLCTATRCYCTVSTMGRSSTCVRIVVRAAYVWDVYWPPARAREDQRRAKNWHLDELNLNPMGWAHRSSHNTSEGFMLTYKHQFIISYASGGPIPPGARSSPPQARSRAAGVPAGGLRPATSAFWRPPSARSCSSGS